MPTNFPNGVDVFSNPAGADPVDASSGATVPHHLQHTNLNDAVLAIENYLLFPFQAPTFGGFSISGQSATVEVGGSTVANPTFTWSTTNPGNVTADSIDITDVTNNVILASGLANDGTEQVTHAAYTRTSTGTQVFRIDGGTTQSGSFSRTLTVTWEWRVFYGKSALTSLTEAQIEALASNALASGFAGTYNFSGAGYLYLCYPASFGAATVFRDTSTGFNVPFDAVTTIFVTNAFGVTTTYNVYKSFNFLNAAISVAVS